MTTALRAALAALAVLLGSTIGHAQEVGPWATYRGNPQRTGNTDGKAGPATPKILWALRTKDNHIASPVPLGDDRLVVSGLGAFNLGTLSCLSTDPAAKVRTLWSKSTPFLKLPTVSSPSVLRGALVFGDGMHQTDGATLYCIGATKGGPLWRLPIPGKLVHLEGSPTLVDGRAYIGGGSAGVLCVQADHVKINGQDVKLPALQARTEAAWKELQAKYEVQKKKDEFAVPPNEDQLPQHSPARLWQQGKDAWHVDAPVNVIGDRVLVGSAFLDKEKLGSRSLFCLSTKDGQTKWKAPLKLNPWGGPSVRGDAVVVTGSSIGYDPKVLRGAKGTIAAFDLATGKPRWSKTVTGGIVGCAALTDDSAIVTATDGKVRAFTLTAGERQWIYDAKMPLFAPAAVAGTVVYAGDLRGVIHAIDLKTGRGLWKLDLGADAAIKAPGMIYGGPIVHGGRLYVATCNLEGPFARQPTVVVCIGEK